MLRVQPEIGRVEATSREFADLFPAIYRHFCRRWAPDEYRPSAEAAAILEHLSDTGPLTVTEAARHFERSQAATSELVERLRRRGLIDRIRDERDQRRHLVWLTEEGRAVVADLRRVLDPKLLDPAFSKLTPRERDGLVAGLRALLAAARDTNRKE